MTSKSKFKVTIDERSVRMNNSLSKYLCAIIVNKDRHKLSLRSSSWSEDRNIDNPAICDCLSWISGKSIILVIHLPSTIDLIRAEDRERVECSKKTVDISIKINNSKLNSWWLSNLPGDDSQIDFSLCSSCLIELHYFRIICKC